jgi:shikimate dehydrogenase
MPVNNSQFHLGLIGWPLGHSLSPVMHRAALQSVGLAGDYRLFPVAPLPEGNSVLRTILDDMRRGKINGLNVTIPHKQTVIPLLDELTTAAQAIGAVNTISKKGGRLTGDNTDWLGFACDLEATFPIDIPEELRQALVLGAGGAARAVVYALARSGWQVTIVSRRLEQAQRLAAELSTLQNSIRTATLSTLNHLPDTRLIVNTTPAGMSPNITESPWPAGMDFPQQAFLYDLIYNPAETALMRSAKAAGLRAANGLGMLAEQAAMAFEMWTGRAISVNIFREAALERNPA